MKKITLLLLMMLAFTWQSNAQCTFPDITYCYANGETDVVIGEICAASPTDYATAFIASGSWEETWDDLTIYEGASGSGTTGTVLAGPLDGDMAGMTFTATNPGTCLIFVSNSDGSVSCSSGSESQLTVYQTAPTFDMTYCYGNGEADVVMFEVTPGAGEIANVSICLGDWEAGYDDLTVYQGAPGSGTTGTLIAGPLDGDLAGTVISSTVAGETLIFVSNSDGSVSCASGDRPTAVFSIEYTLSTQTLENELAFSYFPNPVKNTLNLKAQNNIQNVSVFNMLGQEVLRTAPNALNSEVSMSNLQAGAYFVKVTINNVTETVRIIKN